jgi:hypothetical protein
VRHLQAWSSRFAWVARAREHDAAVAKAEAAARAAAIETEAQKWASRRERTHDTDWQLSIALRTKAAEILRRDLDDPSIRWTLRDAANLAKLASELARLAVGLETERYAVTAPGGGPIQFRAAPPSVDFAAEVLIALQESGALSAIVDPKSLAGPAVPEEG